MIGNAAEYASENVSFCLRARAAGLTISVDSTVRVGHEERIIL